MSEHSGGDWSPSCPQAFASDLRSISEGDNWIAGFSIAQAPYSCTGNIIKTSGHHAAVDLQYRTGGEGVFLGAEPGDHGCDFIDGDEGSTWIPKVIVLGENNEIIRERGIESSAL